MAHDIFISYRRDGGEDMAMFLYERLTALGYGVFIDVKELKSGKFDEGLLTEIESCKDFIVICSKNCFDRCKNESDWLRREIAYALKCKKNIIPLTLRGFDDFPSDLPADIEEIRHYNGIEIIIRFFGAAMDILVGEFLTAKPAPALKIIPRPLIRNRAAFSAKVGGIIRFGEYDWQILEIRDGDAFIISAHILETRAYNREYKSVAWENCSLREYLNNEFLSAFSESDRARICETNNGKVFLPDANEVRKHFTSNTQRKAKYRGEYICWWLRTPGVSNKAVYVNANGTVYAKGLDVYYNDVGIRPVMRLTINS